MSQQYGSTLPPPPPPAPRESYVERERPTATAPFVLGVVGSVVGLVPILGLVAIPLGVIGLVLGIMAWRHKPQRKRLARVATVLSALAIVLGIIGIAIVDKAFDDLEDDLDQIEQEFNQEGE